MNISGPGHHIEFMLLLNKAPRIASFKDLQLLFWSFVEIDSIWEVIGNFP
jgi:hypothetical protein